MTRNVQITILKQQRMFSETIVIEPIFQLKIFRELSQIWEKKNDYKITCKVTKEINAISKSEK